MNFVIEATMDRGGYLFTENDINKRSSKSDFLEQIKDYGYKYIIRGKLNIIDTDTNANAAVFKVVLIDESKAYNDGYSVSGIADLFDQELYDAFYILENSSVYKRKMDENKGFTSLFSGYIETAYVYPEYRRRGISEYIHKNLGEFIEHFFNVSLRCLITFPQPLEINSDGSRKGDFQESKEEMEKMRLIMIKILMDTGFKKIKNHEKYFACAYPKYYWFNS
jgi:hypothetical protein